MSQNDDAAAMRRLGEVSRRLCRPESLDMVWQDSMRMAPMPSLPVLEEIMARLRAALFPGFFGEAKVRRESMEYHLSANLDSIYRLLAEQIRCGYCFSCRDAEVCGQCGRRGEEAALALIEALPEIRALLVSDAEAAYEGDPAATSPGETVFCYPFLWTMIHHRIAHVLYRLGVPLIPRIISEMAHSRTGIDIHPGAQIGEHFFIDHGTGVVVGETTIIGRSCRIYQGVTLGALSFPKNDDGTLVKGILRHPVLGDHVTVYAGATLLGRITIGDGAVIGGNVWVTTDVAPHTFLTQEKARRE